MPKNKLLLLLIPSLLLNLLLLVFKIKPTKPAFTVKVIDVIDGDTFITDDKLRIRLFGVDAPELGDCMGEKAKDRLGELVIGKTVELTEPIPDKFGRLMALVYVNDFLVNEVIVKKGLGLYQRQGGTETEILKQANQYARENSLGIFSQECYQRVANPNNPNCIIKGNIASRNGEKIYYLPNCSNYNQVIVEKNKGESWFCTEREAQDAGYTKSVNCY